MSDLNQKIQNIKSRIKSGAITPDDGFSEISGWLQANPTAATKELNRRRKSDKLSPVDQEILNNQRIIEAQIGNQKAHLIPQDVFNGRSIAEEQQRLYGRGLDAQVGALNRRTGGTQIDAIRALQETDKAFLEAQKTQARNNLIGDLILGAGIFLGN